MASNYTRASGQHATHPMHFFDLGSETSVTLLSAHKILLESYEESMRAWFERVQTEASLWAELPTKIAASGSVAQALEVYGDCVYRQIEMSIEDGHRLFADCQQITRKVANSLGGEPSVTENF